VIRVPEDEPTIGAAITGGMALPGEWSYEPYPPGSGVELLNAIDLVLGL
jgi:hypothetical protein